MKPETTKECGLQNRRSRIRRTFMIANFCKVSIYLLDNPIEKISKLTSDFCVVRGECGIMYNAVNNVELHDSEKGFYKRPFLFCFWS